MDWRDDLIDKELTLLDPAVRGSRERLSALLSVEFREIGASGSSIGRDEVLSCLADEAGWAAQAWDFECRKLEEGVAQVLYSCRIDSRDDGTPRYSRRSSIWRHEAEGWRLVFHQGTAMVSPGQGAWR